MLVTVVHIHGTERGDENRRGKLLTEQLEGCIDLGVGAQSIHVDENFLPLVVVTGCAVSGYLAAGTGHSVCAGTAVAHGASLAVGTDLGSCRSQNLVVIHIEPP